MGHGKRIPAHHDGAGAFDGFPDERAVAQGIEIRIQRTNTPMTILDKPSSDIVIPTIMLPIAPPWWLAWVPASEVDVTRTVTEGWSTTPLIHS